MLEVKDNGNHEGRVKIKWLFYTQNPMVRVRKK